MSAETLDYLSTLPFLEGVELEAVKRLAGVVEERLYEPGQIILEDRGTGYW